MPKKSISPLDNLLTEKQMRDWLLEDTPRPRRHKLLVLNELVRLAEDRGEERGYLECGDVLRAERRDIDDRDTDDKDMDIS